MQYVTLPEALAGLTGGVVFKMPMQLAHVDDVIATAEQRYCAGDILGCVGATRLGTIVKVVAAEVDTEVAVAIGSKKEGRLERGNRAAGSHTGGNHTVPERGACIAAHGGGGGGGGGSMWLVDHPWGTALSTPRRERSAISNGSNSSSGGGSGSGGGSASIGGGNKQEKCRSALYTKHDAKVSDAFHCTIISLHHAL